MRRSLLNSTTMSTHSSSSKLDDDNDGIKSVDEEESDKLFEIQAFDISRRLVRSCRNRWLNLSYWKRATHYPLLIQAELHQEKKFLVESQKITLRREDRSRLHSRNLQNFSAHRRKLSRRSHSALKSKSANETLNVEDVLCWNNENVFWQ